MSLIHLHAFCSDIQSLDIKAVDNPKKHRRLKLIFNNDAYGVEYFNRLGVMSDSALTDILSLGETQIKFHLRRLKSIEQTLMKCVEYYASDILSSKEKFQIDVLAHSLESYFVQVTYDKNVIYDNVDFVEKDFGLNLSMIVNSKVMTLMRLSKSISVFTGIVIEEEVDYEAELTPSSSLRSTPVSYKWIDEQESLKELYHRMVGTFVIDTTEENFIAAFSEKLLGTFLPIRWYDSNASEVLFFVKSLIPGLIYEDGVRMNYQRLVGCFVKPDGNSFDAKSLKSLNQRIEVNLGQAKRDSIKGLVADFL